MPGLRYPGSRPGFDPSHLAARGISNGNGLSFVTLGSSYISLLSGALAGIHANPPTPTIGVIGPGISFPSGNTDLFFSGQSTAAIPSITYGLIFQINTLAGSYQGLMTNGASASPFVINSAGQLEVFASSNITSSLSPAAGVPYFAAVSVLSGSKANFILVNLLNGKISTSAVSTSNTLNAGTAFPLIGDNSGSQPALSSIAAGMMANGLFLSVPELLRWGADPWSFWYPLKRKAFYLFGGGAGGGGTTFPQAVSATCTSTSSLIKSTRKTLTATCTSAVTLIKSISKTLLATCATSVVGTAIKVILKTLVATCTSTTSLTKSVGKSLIVTCTSTSTLIKSVAKSLAAICTSTSTLIKSVSKTLVATCTSTANTVAHKCIVYTQSVIATCTTSVVGTAIKVALAAVASLAAKLRPYKPLPPPVIPGSDTLYLLNELQKVSNAFNAHVAATKDLDARLKAAGF